MEKQNIRILLSIKKSQLKIIIISFSLRQDQSYKVIGPRQVLGCSH